MGTDWIYTIRGVLTKYTGPGPVMPPGKQAGTQHVSDPSAVHRDFDQMAAVAPGAALAEALAAGFRADPGRSVGQKTALLFRASTPAQRSELLNLLLRFKPVAASDDLLKLLSGTREVTPEEAAAIDPELVARIVDGLDRREPLLVERLAQHYAAHAKLVKNLGIEFLVAAIRKIGERLAGFRSAGGGR